MLQCDPEAASSNTSPPTAETAAPTTFVSPSNTPSPSAPPTELPSVLPTPAPTKKEPTTAPTPSPTPPPTFSASSYCERPYQWSDETVTPCGECMHVCMYNVNATGRRYCMLIRYCLQGVVVHPVGYRVLLTDSLRGLVSVLRVWPPVAYSRRRRRERETVVANNKQPQEKHFEVCNEEIRTVLQQTITSTSCPLGWRVRVRCEGKPRRVLWLEQTKSNAIVRARVEEAVVAVGGSDVSRLCCS